jgi:hypothetical protein
MNLFLDDVRPAPHGWTHAHSMREAQELVGSNDVESMSLDHDLGDNMEVCSECAQADQGQPCEDCHCHERPSTGSDFVAWLAAVGKWPKHKPMVHSANPPGALAMRALIDRYGPYETGGVEESAPYGGNRNESK